MRRVESYQLLSNYQFMVIDKFPIKLQMALQPDVDPETREALKYHLLNLSYSFASCKNVIIHVPKKNLTLSYNINPTSDEILEYIIDDVRDHPKPASKWEY